MAAAIAELLAAAKDQLSATNEPRQAALEAVAAFAHVARALDSLYTYRPYEQYIDEQCPTVVPTLAASARAAAACWPAADGPIADLVGVAADAIATRARTFNDPQRWTLSVAFAETARRCVDTARCFPPYRNIPHLTSVRDAAVACEQRAAAAPTRDGDRTALDRLIPTAATTGFSAVIDAAAALHSALLARASPRLSMAELLITVNAAQLATAHAAAIAAHLSPEPGLHPWHRPALAAPEAWQATRLHCRPFDDTTKLRPPTDSPIASAAARLGRTLIDHLGPAPAAGATSAADAATRPDIATALLTVTSLLPDVADRLQLAAHAWGYTGQLWAPERQLLAYEKRTTPTYAPAGVGVATYGDLERLTNSLTLARTLTTALVSDLSTVAETRLPELTRAHTTTATTSKVLSPMATAAHDALRRSHLLPVEEWAVPTKPGPARTQPR